MAAIRLRPEALDVMGDFLGDLGATGVEELQWPSMNRHCQGVLPMIDTGLFNEKGILERGIGLLRGGVRKLHVGYLTLRSIGSFLDAGLCSRMVVMEDFGRTGDGCSIRFEDGGIWVSVAPDKQDIPGTLRWDSPVDDAWTMRRLLWESGAPALDVKHKIGAFEIGVLAAALPGSFHLVVEVSGETPRVLGAALGLVPRGRVDLELGGTVQAIRELFDAIPADGDINELFVKLADDLDTTLIADAIARWLSRGVRIGELTLTGAFTARVMPQIFAELPLEVRRVAIFFTGIDAYDFGQPQFIAEAEFRAHGEALRCLVRRLDDGLRLQEFVWPMAGGLIWNPAVHRAWMQIHERCGRAKQTSD
jgi:hypothetical protein